MRRTLTKPLNPRLLSSETCHAMVTRAKDHDRMIRGRKRPNSLWRNP
jgi:hypothetical protein